MSEPQVTDSAGMSYLDSLPRRVVTVYLPLGVFVFVLCPGDGAPPRTPM